MNIKDFLIALNEDQLLKLAEQTGAMAEWKARKAPIDTLADPPAESLVESLASFYLSEEGCRSILNSMKDYERTLLLHLIKNVLWDSVSFREIEEKLLGELTGIEIKAAVIGLRKKGVLFSLRKLWGEILYVLPRDSAAQWHRVLLSCR